MTLIISRQHSALPGYEKREVRVRHDLTRRVLLLRAQFQKKAAVPLFGVLCSKLQLASRIEDKMLCRVRHRLCLHACAKEVTPMSPFSTLFALSFGAREFACIRRERCLVSLKSRHSAKCTQKSLRPCSIVSVLRSRCMG